ncbi:fructose-1,6-bisphosphatase class 1/Sedoheputulose-1,7-bisphosphatase [Baffinella frigidus]|nr:fructose-1,6-bisphosphatase class 1/Sedoheputulose-1,7-bisphosphatase [Cryptophyta sp. CCMP2293]
MVGKAGIQDMTGFAGTGENIQGEEQKKLDILSNDVFKDKLAKTGCMAFLGSEEEDVAIKLKGNGDYTVVFDPLDGSSNIDAAISVGTIFGVYKGAKGKDEFPLQKGTEQVAAGYCMYSTCTILMITIGDGTHGFTLDSSTGEFIMSHPDVKIPARGKIYSTNQGDP